MVMKRWVSCPKRCTDIDTDTYENDDYNLYNLSLDRDAN